MDPITTPARIRVTMGVSPRTLASEYAPKTAITEKMNADNWRDSRKVWSTIAKAAPKAAP